MFKLLAVPVVALLFAGGSFWGVVNTAPTEDQKAARLAADCAGLPKGIVENVGKHYLHEGTVGLSELPTEYDIRQVAVYPEGGCRVEPVAHLADIPQGQALVFQHAIGLIDLDDTQKKGLPFYLLIELEGPVTARHREYLVLSLPEPAVEPPPPSTVPGRVT